MSISIIVCRVGRAPVVEPIAADEQGSHLTASQRIVGGYVEMVRLGAGLDLWCNEEARINGLPFNRNVLSIALSCIYDIHGDFFLARSTPDGELASVTAEDITDFGAVAA